VAERKVRLVVTYEAIVDGAECGLDCPHSFGDYRTNRCAIFNDQDTTIDGRDMRLPECLSAEPTAPTAGEPD